MNRTMTVFRVGMMFLFLTWVKISDFLLFNQYLGRIGNNYIYIFLGLAVLFSVFKIKGGSDLTSSGVNYLPMLHGVLFVIPFYFIGYVAEFLYSRNLSSDTSMILMAEGFRISESAHGNTVILRIILIIIFSICLTLLEDGYFRFLFYADLKKVVKPIYAAIITSVLFGIWSGVSLVRNTSGVTKGILIESGILALTGLLLCLKWCLMEEYWEDFWVPFGDHLAMLLLMNIFHITGKGAMDRYVLIRYSALTILPMIFLLILNNRRRKDKDNRKKVAKKEPDSSPEVGISVLEMDEE